MVTGWPDAFACANDATTSARVATAAVEPASTLFDQTGGMVLDLEKTDANGLKEAGFIAPEPFRVKADDGPKLAPALPRVEEVTHSCEGVAALLQPHYRTETFPV